MISDNVLQPVNVKEEKERERERERTREGRRRCIFEAEGRGTTERRTQKESILVQFAKTWISSLPPSHKVSISCRNLCVFIGEDPGRFDNACV